MPHYIKRSLFPLAFLVLIGGLMIPAPALHAQPVRDRVIEDVTVTRSDGAYLVRILFSFPVRYQSHFPQDSGEELRVTLTPSVVGATEEDAVSERESVRLSGDSPAYEVIWEGDAEGGPFLTVLFREPVPFSVQPGRDFRSLTISIHAPELAPPTR